MPNYPANSTSGLQIGNPNPFPDGNVLNIQVVTQAAAGTTQATAALIAAPVTVITNNTTANGVILPVGVRGQTAVIIPQLVTDAPKVYPPVGGTVNFGTANASVASPARRAVTYLCTSDDGLSWVSTSLTA
jgi:hypothetical protein